MKAAALPPRSMPKAPLALCAALACALSGFAPTSQRAVADEEEAPEAARRDVARAHLPGYPRVFRNFMPDAGPSAFAVELAEGLTLIYDPLRGGINAAWLGGIDLAPTVQAKINEPADIVGEIFYRETMRQPLRRAGADGEEPERRFRGYRYESGAVVFESTIDGVAVTETIRALPGGSGFERVFAPEPGAEALVFVAEAAELRGSGATASLENGLGGESSEPLAMADSPLVQRVSAEGASGAE